MMVSFMRCFKKPDVLARVALGLLFVSLLSWAAASSLQIKTAELIATDEAYLLNADFELNLSEEAEDALNKGVQLNFLVEFQLYRPRKYWFDDEVVTRTDHVAFSYHALSRQYLLNRNNHQQTFTSLQEAKEEFVSLRGWKVIDKSMLSKDETYGAKLRIRLDTSKLPKPIQVDALGSESWNLVSQRYHWKPVLVY